MSVLYDINGNYLKTNTLEGQTQPTLQVTSIPSNGIQYSYSATTTQLSVTASATDVFTINGSSTKTIYIQKIGISGTSSAITIDNISLISRTSSNIGGTKTTLTNVTHDTQNPAASATVVSYTSNPTTLGATAGTLRSSYLTIPTNTSVLACPILQWNFADSASQPIVLRGTASCVSVNLNGNNSSTNNVDIYVSWIEA